MEQFINYTTMTLTSNEYEVSLHGRTNLHLGALPTTDVTFQETVTLDGKN